MAIKQLRIAGLEDILQWDDGDFGNALETTETIVVGGIESGAMPAIVVADTDLIVLRDNSNGDALSTCTVAQLKAHFGL